MYVLGILSLVIHFGKTLPGILTPEKINPFTAACQGRSQNLKEIPQNFTEVFNIDDVTAKETDVAKKKK